MERKVFRVFLHIHPQIVLKICKITLLFSVLVYRREETSMEDREIIELYNLRSETAIAQTDVKYGAFCRSIAFHILRDTEDAAECVSDTYLAVWNTIPPSQPQCLRAFLGKITRNLSLNRLEKQHAQKRGGTQAELVLEELSSCIPDKSVAEDITEDIVIRETLNRFLKTLSETERRVFVRRYWYADTAGEIAVKLSITENRVYVLLHRARKKLKVMLEKEGITL